MADGAKTTAVGMIGLGAMGRGIALNLSKHVLDTPHHIPLLVWNRTASKADDIVAAGAKFADGGIAEVARTCDITFCMCFDDQSLLDILREFCQERKPQGSIFVSMPTVHPTTTSQASSVASKAGVTFVACPVFGRPDAARNKTLVCVVAGPPAAKATLAPYLAAIGRGTLDLGEDPSTASVQKLVGNFLIVGMVELMSEAMTLGDKNGLPRDQFLEFVKTFFPAPAVTGYATRMAHSEFSTNGGKDGFTVDGGIKDATLITRLASESGVNALVAQAALEHLQRQKATGAADKDFGSLIEIVRKDAGLSS